MIFETVETLRGNKVERIKSSLFYLLGICCLPVGYFLITNDIILGAFLILTACPFFLLYPLVRFMFGGKDSVAAVVATVVIEEVLKGEIKNAGNKNRRR